MKTRCKFVCDSITKHGYAGMPKDGSRQETVKFHATYEGGTQENISFSEATPNGTLEITVSNPAVVGTFELGGYYYLDLIPA